MKFMSRMNGTLYLERPANMGRSAKRVMATEIVGLMSRLIERADDYQCYNIFYIEITPIGSRVPTIACSKSIIRVKSKLLRAMYKDFINNTKCNNFEVCICMTSNIGE